MKKKSYYSILIIFGSIFCLPLFLNATSIGHQNGEGPDDEVEHQVEFNYKEGSKEGPSKWGELHKEWETCKNGKMQSPIDISSCGVKIKRKLGHKKLYKPSNSTLRNRGHDISLHWHGDAGSILMNGTKYPLLQIHWHSPSEHTINGRRYALELHMVHHNTDDEKVKNKIVVNAVLYRFGRPDPFLFILRRHILSMVDQEGEESNLGIINPIYVTNNYSKSYYKYKGSLTTPPCTEGVTWLVNKKVQTVSRFQVKLLRKAVHDHAERNARPLQPRNKRRIHLYSRACEYPSCQL